MKCNTLNLETSNEKQISGWARAPQPQPQYRKIKELEQHWNFSSAHLNHILFYDTWPDRQYTFKVNFCYISGHKPDIWWCKMPFSNTHIQLEAHDHGLISATEQKFIRE